MAKKVQFIQRILIANRGEIASRIIRTCKKMGIQSVAVFSDADQASPFVKEADVAIHIGESSPVASYLDQEKIIKAAKATNADAIHPGYGFLAENAVFAQRCKKAGIIFIGPNPVAIIAMGSKSEAKSLMRKHKVPVVPGYEGSDQSTARLTREAKSMGFPVLLKATAGGGGKGMRIVNDAQEIEKAINSAKRESKAAFGNDELIVEKYIASGRHIEFQIFGDKHGNVIHLLERECSIQRRYQKVVEESPSPIMNKKLRDEMGSAAVNAAKALNYDNAGTVEFIYDDKTARFYFLEVNTRLQVEHPVTEEVTGLDLVQMQIESAQGLPLAHKQRDIKGRGYAIEARLYAEDAANDFLPVTGKIIKFDLPDVDGLRIETAIEAGSEISIFYDPMIAKIIVWDETRAAAHRKLNYVLTKMVCHGITTNQEFLLALTKNADFRQGKYNTHFIANEMDLRKLSDTSEADFATAGIAATLFRWNERNAKRTMLRSMPSGWRNSFVQHQAESYQVNDQELEVKYRFQKGSFECLVGEAKYEVKIIAVQSDGLSVQVDGQIQHFRISQEGSKYFVQSDQIGSLLLTLNNRFPAVVGEEEQGGYSAPMPSQIVKVLVGPGDEVEAGDGLIILSSMKMESIIEANESGSIEEIYATEGGSVEAGFVLLKMKENE